MATSSRFIPKRGDIVWVSLSPQQGREQAGRRPAIVISPEAYNAQVGLALMCPITSEINGYPFEVLIPGGIPLEGAVLSDQVRCLDWRARKAELICAVPLPVILEVLGKLATLTGG